MYKNKYVLCFNVAFIDFRKIAATLLPSSINKKRQFDTRLNYAEAKFT